MVKRKIQETIPKEVAESIISTLSKHGLKDAASLIAKETKIDTKKVKVSPDHLLKLFDSGKKGGSEEKPSKKQKTKATEDSSSSESSSEDEKPTKKVSKKDSDSEEDSSEDESEDEKPAAKKSKKDNDSSDDSDSDSEDEKPVAKKVPETKQVTNKEENDSSDSDDSDSEDEKPTAKKVTVKKDDSSDDDDDSSESSEEKPASKAKVTTKKEESESEEDSSDEDSDDESDNGDKKKASNKTTEKSESSSEDDDDDDDEEEEEEEKPKKSAPATKTTPAPKAAPASNGESNGEDLKIFVKGLPWSATEAEVADFFKGCGSITSTELPLSPEGRSSGTAYVTFADRAGIDAALALDGETWPGTERWLKIEEARKAERKSFGSASGGVRPEGCDTVFVGNLPWEVEEADMRAVFESAGEIAGVRFATSQEDGSFRGFGHVSFYNGEDTEKAVQLAGTPIHGRAIRVDYAPPRNRDSFGGGGGAGRSPGGRGGGRGGGFGGGRGGGRGRGGPGRGGPPNKNKGSIAVSAGKKMTFD